MLLIVLSIFKISHLTLLRCFRSDGHDGRLKGLPMDGGTYVYAQLLLRRVLSNEIAPHIFLRPCNRGPIPEPQVCRPSWPAKSLVGGRDLFLVGKRKGTRSLFLLSFIVLEKSDVLSMSGGNLFRFEVFSIEADLELERYF